MARPGARKKKDKVPRNILAKLYGGILHELQLTPSVLKNLMQRWANDRVKYNGISADKAQTDKSNLLRALSESNITWKVLERVISILGPESYKVSIELTMPDGTKCIVNDDVAGSSLLSEDSDVDGEVTGLNVSITHQDQITTSHGYKLQPPPALPDLPPLPVDPTTPDLSEWHPDDPA